jgi:Epoxide hydrolase N terminus
MSYGGESRQRAGQSGTPSPIRRGCPASDDAGARPLLGHRPRLPESRDEGNALPQFDAEIDDLDIHFIHARSRHKNPLPLIITHTAGLRHRDAQRRRSAHRP